MHDPVMKRATLAARHDFDLLPKSMEIEVRAARHSELSALADMANRLVPGVQITEPDLERYFSFDPGSILTFSRNNKLLGAVAFIYLNRRGHDALIRADMNLTRPDFGLLAGRSDQACAITSGRSPVMAGRWPGWATYRRISPRRGWRRPISMRNPRARTDAI
jgi:hypothetical protein